MPVSNAARADVPKEIALTKAIRSRGQHCFPMRKTIWASQRMSLHNKMRSPTPRTRSDPFASSISEPIHLVQPPSAVWFTSFGLLALLCLVGFVTLGTYTRRITAQGIIAPSGGAIPIGVPSKGVVSKILVKDGQHVKRGDLLFTVVDDRRKPESETLEAYDSVRRTANENRLNEIGEHEKYRLMSDKASQNATKKKRESFNREIQENIRQQGVERDRLELAHRSLTRHLDLARSGYVAASLVDAKREDVATREAQIIAMRREHISLVQKIADLYAEDEKRSLETQIDLALQRRQRSLLGYEEATRGVQSNYAVVAVADGTVTGIVAREGSYVVDAAVAVLIPDGVELTAELYLESSAVGFIEPGQVVMLRIGAFPYQHYGQKKGFISEITESPLASGGIAPIDSRQTAPAFRVRVRLPDSVMHSQVGERHLKPGMAVEGSIELERRALIHWLLKPLYGLKIKLAGE